jgi:hypothetical protein
MRPASADVMDVTVDGSVSGNGSVTVECALGTPGCVPGGPLPGGGLFTSDYSFNSTNTQLTFSDSGSVTSPIFSVATASSFASQNVSATSESLGFVLTGGHSATGPFYTAFESDTISVGFDLTESSMVQLTGGGFGVSSNVGELLDSDGNVILVIPNSPVPVSALLAPGTYTLQGSASGGGTGTAFAPVDTTDFNFGVGADFTPVATPELQGAPLAAVSATLVGVFAASRRFGKRSIR